jgi:cell division protein FtsQ
VAGTRRTRPAARARPSRAPARARRRRIDVVARFAPPPRVLGIAVASAGILVGGFVVARHTSLFAVRSIDVRGAPAPVAAQVQATLARWRGRSLVGLDGAAIVRSLDELPAVQSVSYDRAFPHTLRVVVAPERPVAVLRRGADAWLVSARARVLRRVPQRAQSQLPRVWVPTAAQVVIGQVLAPKDGGEVARAVAPLARDGFPVRVATAVLARGELVLALASHVELRLGEPADVLLKLAIARRIVRSVPTGTGYIDVSVPERPVAGPATPVAQPSTTNPQPSG